MQFLSNAQITKILGKYRKSRSTEIAERLLDEIYKLNDADFASLSLEGKIQAFKQRPLHIEFLRPAIKDTYFTKAMDEDGSLGILFEENGHHLQEVDVGGWAFRNGLIVSDEIIAVNGSSLEGKTDDERCSVAFPGG